MRISDWSSDVCSSDLLQVAESLGAALKSGKAASRGAPPTFACTSMAHRESSPINPRSAQSCVTEGFEPFGTDAAITPGVPMFSAHSCARTAKEPHNETPSSDQDHPRRQRPDAQRPVDRKSTSLNSSN